MRKLIIIIALLPAGCGEDPGGKSQDCVQLADIPLAGVTAMAISPDANSVVIGHQGLTLYDFRSGDSLSFGAADGMASDEVADIAIASDGTIWVGHAMALCADTQTGQCGASKRAPDGAWTRHDRDGTDLHDGRILTVAVAPDGELWAGTPGGATHTVDGWGWASYAGWQSCASPGAQCDPLFSFQLGDIDFAANGAAWMAIDQQAIGVSPKPGGFARRNTDTTTDTWDLDHGLPQNRATTAGSIDGDSALAGGPWGAAWVSISGVEVLAETAAQVAAGDYAWMATDGALVRNPHSAPLTLETGAIDVLAADHDVVCYATGGRVRCSTESCPQ